MRGESPNLADYFTVASYFNQAAERKDQKARQAHEDKINKETTDLFGKFMNSKKQDFTDVDVSGMDPEAVRRTQIQATGTRMNQLNWSQQSMEMQQKKWGQQWQLANERLRKVEDLINQGQVDAAMQEMMDINNKHIPNGLTIELLDNGNYQISSPSGEIKELPMGGMKPLDALKYMKGHIENQDFFIKGGLAYREAARQSIIEQYMNPKQVVAEDGKVGYVIWETTPDSMVPALKVYDHLPGPNSKPLSDEEARKYHIPGNKTTGKYSAFPDSEYITGPDGKVMKNPHPKKEKPPVTPAQAYKRITDLMTLKAKIEQGVAAIASFIQSNPDSFMNSSQEFQTMLQLFSSKAGKQEVSEGTVRALAQAIDQEKRYMESFIEDKPAPKNLTREEAMKYYNQAAEEILKGVPAEQREAKETELMNDILTKARELAAADGR